MEEHRNFLKTVGGRNSSYSQTIKGGSVWNNLVRNNEVRGGGDLTERETVIKNLCKSIANIFKKSISESGDVSEMVRSVINMMPKQDQTIEASEATVVRLVAKAINSALKTNIPFDGVQPKIVLNDVVLTLTSLILGVHTDLTNAVANVQTMLQNLEDFVELQQILIGKLQTELDKQSFDDKDLIKKTIKSIEGVISSANSKVRTIKQSITGASKTKDIEIHNLKYLNDLMLRSENKSIDLDTELDPSHMIQLLGEVTYYAYAVNDALTKLNKLKEFEALNVKDKKEVDSFIKSLHSELDKKILDKPDNAGELKKIQDILNLALKSKTPERLQEIQSMMSSLDAAKISGGTEVTETSIQRSHRKQLENQVALMKAFNKAINVEFEKINEEFNFGKDIGMSLPISESLINLAEKMGNIADFGNTDTYLGLIGIDKSTVGESIYNSYMRSIDEILSSIEEVSKISAYSSLSARIDTIKSMFVKFKSTIDTYRSKMAQISNTFSKSGGSVDLLSMGVDKSIMDSSTKDVDLYMSNYSSRGITGGGVENNLEVLREALPSTNKFLVSSAEKLKSFKYYLRIAAIRDNLKNIRGEISSNSDQYNTMTSVMIANKIKQLNSKKLEDIKAHTNLSPKIFEHEFQVKKNLLEVAQGIDLQLKNVTEELIKDPEMIKDIKSFIESNEAIAYWYDESSGNKLAEVFEMFNSTVGFSDNHTHYYDYVKSLFGSSNLDQIYELYNTCPTSISKNQYEIILKYNMESFFNPSNYDDLVKLRSKFNTKSTVGINILASVLPLYYRNLMLKQDNPKTNITTDTRPPTEVPFDKLCISGFLFNSGEQKNPNLEIFDSMSTIHLDSLLYAGAEFDSNKVIKGGGVRSYYNNSFNYNRYKDNSNVDYDEYDYTSPGQYTSDHNNYSKLATSSYNLFDCRIIDLLNTQISGKIKNLDSPDINISNSHITHAVIEAVTGLNLANSDAYLKATFIGMYPFLIFAFRYPYIDSEDVRGMVLDNLIKNLDDCITCISEFVKSVVENKAMSNVASKLGNYIRINNRIGLGMIDTVCTPIMMEEMMSDMKSFNTKNAGSKQSLFKTYIELLIKRVSTYNSHNYNIVIPQILSNKFTGIDLFDLACALPNALQLENAGMLIELMNSVGSILQTYITESTNNTLKNGYVNSIVSEMNPSTNSVVYDGTRINNADILKGHIKESENIIWSLGSVGNYISTDHYDNLIKKMKEVFISNSSLKNLLEVFFKIENSESHENYIPTRILFSRILDYAVRSSIDVGKGNRDMDEQLDHRFQISNNNEHLYLTTTGNSYGNISFEDEDELFTHIIKAIVAKIYTVLGIYNLMENPSNTTKPNTVRLLIGGGNKSRDDMNLKYAGVDTPVVHDEISDLYSKLLLYLEFYKDIFNLDNANDEYNISMIPELTSPFNKVIDLIFKRNRNSAGVYSPDDIKLYVTYVNEIYDKLKSESKTPDQVTRYIISMLVNEVNKRYGILTDKDKEVYNSDKLMSYQLSNPSSSSNKPYNSMLLPDENLNDEDFNYVPPSAKYLSDDLQNYDSKTYKLNDVRMNELKARNNNGVSELVTGTWKKRVEALYKFRKAIDEYFDKDDTVDIGENVKSLAHLKRDLSHAKTPDERFNIISQTLLGDNFTTLSNQIRYIMFHETVITNLTVMKKLYIGRRLMKYLKKMK
jgi:hypothetical protein